MEDTDALPDTPEADNDGLLNACREVFELTVVVDGVDSCVVEAGEVGAVDELVGVVEVLVGVVFATAQIAVTTRVFPAFTPDPSPGLHLVEPVSGKNDSLSTGQAPIK